MGVAEGELEGEVDGEFDGAFVGLSVVGASVVGSWVGLSVVGACVVGASVGCAVGEMSGARVAVGRSESLGARNKSVPLPSETWACAVYKTQFWRPMHSVTLELPRMVTTHRPSKGKVKV